MNTWFVIFTHLGDEEWTSSNKVPAASLRSLLTHFLDISSPPTQPLLQSLVASVTDKQKVGELISLAAQVGLRWSADDAKNPGLTDQWPMFDTGILCMCLAPMDIIPQVCEVGLSYQYQMINIFQQ